MLPMKFFGEPWIVLALRRKESFLEREKEFPSLYFSINELERINWFTVKRIFLEIELFIRGPHNPFVYTE